MQLLVSVRNATEARIAAEHAVSIIDIKEPTNGSLGRPDPTVVSEILGELKIDQVVSIALGELVDISPGQLKEYFADCKIPQQTVFAKIGLSNATDLKNWRTAWKHRLAELPERISPVAVAYADSENAKSPPTQVVLEVGIQLGVNAFLLDTFSKSSGNCFSHIADADFKRLSQLTQTNQIKFVLAGSITSSNLIRAHELEVDLIGVRGAVCEEGLRTLKLSPSRLKHFMAEVVSFSNRERYPTCNEQVVQKILDIGI